MAVVEAYCADLRRVHASGGASGERSNYGPLANLLNAVGAALKPEVFCVGELANQGAGHPDFGLYAAKQVQRGRPREGQLPERGVVEVKSADEGCLAHRDGRSGQPLLGPLSAGTRDQLARLRTGGQERAGDARQSWQRMAVRAASGGFGRRRCRNCRRAGFGRGLCFRHTHGRPVRRAALH